MSDAIYVIRNQLGQYWTRAQEWVDGREPQRLLKHKHHDEALNQLVELSAKDIELRGDIVRCETNAKGEAVVAVSDHRTPTLAEKAAAEAANSDDALGTADAGDQSLSDTGPVAEGVEDASHASAGEEPPGRQAVS